MKTALVGRRMPGSLLQALRTLRQRPVTTTVMLAMLSVAVGLNTAIFSFVDATLLRPFPYPASDRLFVTWGTPDFFQRRGVDGRIYAVIGARAVTIADIAPFRVTPFSFSIGGAGPTLQGAFVSTRTFSVLGRQTSFGRTFADDDETQSTVVLSHWFWRHHLGGRPDVIGSTVRVLQKQYQVIGVMPADFFFPDYSVALWLPMAAASDQHRQVQAIVRAKEAVTPADVAREFSAIAQSIDLPAHSRPLRLGVFPLRQLVLQNHSQASLVLFACAALLLIAAAANVSNWMLHRSLSHVRRTATMLCLGAAPRHLLRLVLAEVAMCAIATSAGGSLLAYCTLPALRRFASMTLLNHAMPELNVRALLYSVVVSVVALGLAAVVPTSYALRTEPALAWSSHHRLRLGGRSARFALLALQVCLATVTLIGATLLTRTFVRLTTVDWGFDPDHLVVARVKLTSDLVTPTNREAFTEGVRRLLQEVPSVRSTAMAYGVPIEFNTWQPGTVRSGHSITSAGIWVVSDRYFETMGIPLVAGKSFRHSAHGVNLREAVVNTRFLRSVSPEPALGHSFTLLKVRGTVSPQRYRADPAVLRSADAWEPDGASWAVSGVVGDVRMFGLEDEVGPAIYVDYRDRPLKQQTQVFIVRTSGDDASLAPIVRDAVGRMAAEARVESYFSMRDLIGRSVEGTSSPRLLAVTMGTISLLAVLIAGAGTYSIAAMDIAARAHELAIRRALGAGTRQLASALYRPLLSSITLGILVGLLLSRLGAGTMSSLLFETSPVSGALYGGCAIAVAVLCVVSGSVLFLRSLRTPLTSLLRGD